MDRIDDINEEIVRRIEIIEDPNYEGVPRLNSKDYTWSIIVGVVCFIMMIVGYYL